MQKFIKIKNRNTPSCEKLSLSLKNPMRKAPEGGWEERTWYLVEVAFNNNNPVHKKMFFTGFISDGKPCGYNEFARSEDNLEYNDSVYLRPVKRLFSEEELEIY
jgi:hypothetical protein